MLKPRVVLACVVACAVSLAGAVAATGQSSGSVKVLLFHGGTSHESVDAAVDAITDLGDANDFEVDASDNAADFTQATLADYRAVIALHSSGNVLDSSQQSALQGFIQSGGGFLAIGEAANLQPGVGFFNNLIGARPAASSPTAPSAQIVEVGDRVHPATRELPLEWGPREDVFYEWQQNPTGQVHTVARVRHGQTADDGWRNGTTSLPIAWCRDFQGGRSFYTGMGRTTAGWSEANLREHVLGAIEWTGGMVRGGCKATISSNYESVRLTNGANGLANAGEAHGVTVAPNGWVITTSRADCTSNEERGARVGQGSLGRTLNFADPNVGVGCAPIYVWDPDEYEGTLNSGNTRAGTLTVYGDRGSGGEINGKIETGGLGITVAPDFEETGHLYVLYFPVFNQNPVHPGLSDGAERRITKMGVGRISRFTLDLDTKQLDLASEVPIFEYDSQIYSCCHRGGGMGFDSEGNLYVTTGDSNSSGSTGGYSGNFQPNACPTGDPNTASNAHCGDNPVSYNDARRTAGSTNDYNGKMLRLNPVESIDDGERPEIGPGTTYTLPDADSPNGPNLFSGSEGDGDQAKPEIYAMGLRNPSRLSIDPATDEPYTAWVGPDAGSPSATQGPSTYEPAAKIHEAGNWGWPYCMGDNQAYRDRLANGSLRTTNAPGFVTGGPAGSPTEGWYDCQNLVNDSTRNTGLTVLPHATGTGKDAGAAKAANIWWSRGNAAGNNGCPSFPREHGPDGAPNYGATPTSLCPYVGGGGMTIMNGPVYRYQEGADNSIRWPAYWDGRWFVHDFSSGNSKSLGLVLDPEEEGNVPVYVDRMSQYVSWQGGSYMDSEYGLDGALYLQTYDGSYFFQGQNDGLHRISYTGGPDTPNPDPQWQSLGGGEIEFSIGRSGGVAYEWDFGDGSETSNEPNPTHAYAEPGSYEVTLTVTYADDEELDGTIDVFLSDDQDPPQTTAEIDGDEPAESYDGPVDVTLSATDGSDEDASGVERTDYRIDGGAWVESPNADEDDPFVTEFRVSGDGERTVEFRSRDRAGNVEEIQSVEFEIDSDSGSGPACLPQSDEFDGDALDAKWDVLRPTGNVSVADGRVSIPINQGDFIANNPLASDALLQDAPDGEWTVTTKLDTSDIDTNGEQAGLLIWKSESPNVFAKLVAIQSNAGNHQFEYIVTQNGSVNPPIAQSITPAPGGQLPAEVLLRARSTGTQVIGEFSADDGQTWVRVGQEGHAAPLTAPLRVGLTAFRGNNGGGQAHFDWFRVHGGSDAGGPIACGAPSSCLPQTDEFNGSGLDEKWEIVNGNPANRSVADGNLNLTTAQGDVLAGNFTAQNILMQEVPDGPWTATVKLDHTAIDTNGQAGGMVIYGSHNPASNNNFAKTAIQYKNNDLSGNPMNGIWAERALTTGGATNPNYGGDGEYGPNPNYPNSGKLEPPTDDIWVRVTFDGVEVGTWYSLDGQSWNRSAPPFPASELGANGVTKVGVFVKHDSGNPPTTVPFDWFRVHAGADAQRGTSCAGAACSPYSDQFTGDELDPKWEVVNPNAGNPATVADGHLHLPMILGDLFGSNPPAQNLLLQPAPAGESWVATAKVAHANVDTDGEAAGLGLVNRFDPNHFMKTAVQFKNDTDPDTPGNQPGKWAERVLTANNSAVTLPGESVPWPNSGALEIDGDYVWVRFVYDAGEDEVTTWTSIDGTTFVRFGAAVPVDEHLSEPGGLRVGLFAKRDGASQDDVVQFDAFNVVVGSSDPQTPGDDCGAGTEDDTIPPITTHSLDPADPDGGAGWYVSPVEVTLSATDNEGGSGVEATEYRFAGETDWTPYDGPFTVEDDGRHEIEYRSRDVAGNTETTRSASFRIDSAAPETEALLNGAEPVPNYNGPVDLELLADDGDGSGVSGTEVRIDGGDWQPYVTEETILGSESDLERWSQAGPGGLNWVEADPGMGDSVVAVEASGDSPANEGPGNLFDGVPQTKWLTFESTGWVEFELSEPVAATRYTLTSANDFPTRDPMDWTFSGSNDGANWTELDQRSGEAFPERFLTKNYEFENDTAYSHFRLEVTANNGANIVQIADLLLPEAGPDPEGSGFARTFGGLGMPWYPVKEYGDFSLKMQWRDSGAGSNGNSGIFARFPHPEDAVALPPAERHSCQVGSAQSQPAWVAIFCGHEIQINDHQASEPQKTGSVYNFSPLNEAQAQVQPKGTWVDYELRVVGQTYTMIRNGEVLQEWENAPDQNSSRPGDPPTNDRQFASGYIGLQNHGGSDVIDFRDVRVLPLDEGSVEGPITIEGDGEHTVEFRSADVAGNEEETKEVNFTIGDGSGDTTPPVTTHELDPADPGAGGTYDGPVDVNLSATDPDVGGGSEPETHEVDAYPATWDPDALSIASGDEVQWNFPSETAGLNHNVFLVPPGAEPGSEEEFEVTDGIVPPGGPSVSYQFEDEGDWIFYCSLHAFWDSGSQQWFGDMHGTIDVSGGGGSGPSGVDYTEYRVNTDGATGDWEQSQNSGGDDPFETTVPVTDEGDHVVEYRSVDNAGNFEAIKSVAFSIDSDEPRFSVLAFSRTQGFRHDSIPAGHAMLQQLATEHDFEVHGTEDPAEFTEANLANYDTVVFLSTTGNVLNQAQQDAFESYIQSGGGFVGIHAASDTEYDWPWYGNLVGAYFLDHPPGTSNAAIDVEDQEHPSTAGLPNRYNRVDEWYNFKSPDFLEVGSDPFNPRPNVHVLATVDESTYNAGPNGLGDDHPVTWCHEYDGGRSWYTAMGHTTASFSEANFRQQVLGGLVTTAGVEASDSCGVDVVNNPPVIEEVSADPDNGDAPLEVSFSVEASDPDGDELSYSWDFGDGGSSTEQSPTHTYTEPGTYEATVTVSDGEAEVSDSVTVTVNEPDPTNNPPVINSISADPSSGTAPLDVDFSVEASDPDGDELSYSWDFGDGNGSDQQNPTHTYADPGTYEAEVTVSDGQAEVSDSVTVVVNQPGDDVTPPVTTAQLFPSMPGPGGTYERPVTVVFIATDEEGGSGVDYTEYSVNGGDWVTYDPFNPLVVAGDGNHVVLFRSADNAGNVEQDRSVEFSIDTPIVLEPEVVAEVSPTLRRVGPKKKRTAFRLRVTNVGTASTGQLNLCAQAPKKRLRVQGQRCRVVGDLAPSASTQQQFRFNIRPKARGKVTQIQFIARGPAFENQRTTARLRVRK